MNLNIVAYPDQCPDDIEFEPTSAEAAHYGTLRWDAFATVLNDPTINGTETWNRTLVGMLVLMEKFGPNWQQHASSFEQFFLACFDTALVWERG